MLWAPGVRWVLWVPGLLWVPGSCGWALGARVSWQRAFCQDGAREPCFGGRGRLVLGVAVVGLLVCLVGLVVGACWAWGWRCAVGGGGRRVRGAVGLVAFGCVVVCDPEPFLRLGGVWASGLALAGLSGWWLLWAPSAGARPFSSPGCFGERGRGVCGPAAGGVSSPAALCPCPCPGCGLGVAWFFLFWLSPCGGRGSCQVVSVCRCLGLPSGSLPSPSL